MQREYSDKATEEASAGYRRRNGRGRGTKIFSGGQEYSTIPKNTGGSVAGYRDG